MVWPRLRAAFSIQRGSASRERGSHDTRKPLFFAVVTRRRWPWSLGETSTSTVVEGGFFA